MYIDDSPITEFDAKQLYDKKIHPLVEEIRKICIVAKVPFFITTVVKSTKNSTEYKNDGILTGSNEIHLADDKFERFLMVCRGAEIKSPIKGILDSMDAMEYIASPPDDDIVQDEDADIDDELVPTDEEIANPPVDDKKGRLKKETDDNDLGIESVGDI